MGLSGPASGGAAAAEAAANSASQTGIIPQPNAIVPRSGWFTFDSRTVIRVPRAIRTGAQRRRLFGRSVDALPAVRARNRERRRRLGRVGWFSRATPANLAPAHAQSAVTFRRRAGLDPEAYRLEITARGIVISATRGAGLFYGAVTLWQMLMPGWRVCGGGAIISGTNTSRANHSRRTGISLARSDARLGAALSIRRVHPVYDRRHGSNKLNVLHWHLTDDQGWRLEIRNTRG